MSSTSSTAPATRSSRPTVRATGRRRRPKAGSSSSSGSAGISRREDRTMCSYVTEKTAVEGSGKGPDGWFELSHASVYLDHPYFTPLEHTLNIDFIREDAGAQARVAVELSP